MDKIKGFRYIKFSGVDPNRNDDDMGISGQLDVGKPEVPRA